MLAHLLRSAGFGANRDELGVYAAKGYEATVEELLHPEQAPPGLGDDDLVRRYHVEQNSFQAVAPARVYWLYRMINPESTEGRPWGQPLKKLEGAPVNLG